MLKTISRRAFLRLCLLAGGSARLAWGRRVLAMPVASAGAGQTGQPSATNLTYLPFVSKSIYDLPVEQDLFMYRVTVTDGQATTPKLTFMAGYPTALMDWGDGTARSAVTSGEELNHTYTTGGTYTVKLVMTNQPGWITQIDINSDKVVGGVTASQKFPKLTVFYMHINTAWVQDISGWQLLTGNVSFSIGGTSVYGDISNWVIPASMINFQIYSTYVSGDTSNWVIPTGMTYYYVYRTSLTGVPVLSSMVSIKGINAADCGLPQTSIDLYLSRCVAREANTICATPTLNLGGANAKPSNPTGLADEATLVAASWICTIHSVDYLVTFGDSITAGAGASDEAHRWANIVATTRSMALINSGIGGTVLQNTVQNTMSPLGAPRPNNGRDTYISRIRNYYPGDIYILYGFNDLRFTDPAFTVALFENELGEIIDGLIASGVVAQHIVIGSPPYMSTTGFALGIGIWDGGSAAKSALYALACWNVAIAKGTKYVDIFAYMAAHGGDKLTVSPGDNIHSNDAGHAAIATAFLAA